MIDLSDFGDMNCEQLNNRLNSLENATMALNESEHLNSDDRHGMSKSDGTYSTDMVGVASFLVHLSPAEQKPCGGPGHNSYSGKHTAVGMA